MLLAGAASAPLAAARRRHGCRRARRAIGWRRARSTDGDPDFQPRAIIDWGSFSVGEGAGGELANGSGATLNRVTRSNQPLCDRWIAERHRQRLPDQPQRRDRRQERGDLHRRQLRRLDAGYSGRRVHGGWAPELHRVQQCPGGQPRPDRQPSAATSRCWPRPWWRTTGPSPQARATLACSAGSSVLLLSDQALAERQVHRRRGGLQRPERHQHRRDRSGGSRAPRQRRQRLCAGWQHRLGDQGHRRLQQRRQGVPRRRGRQHRSAQGQIAATGDVEDTSGESVELRPASASATPGWLDRSLRSDHRHRSRLDHPDSNLATSVLLKTTASGTSGPGNPDPSGVGDINITAAISWASANTLRRWTPTTASTSPRPSRWPGRGQGGPAHHQRWRNRRRLQFRPRPHRPFRQPRPSLGPPAGPSLTINGQAYTLLYKLTDSAAATSQRPTPA